MGRVSSTMNVPPRLPILSEFLLLIVNALTCTLSFLPYKLQVYTSTFMIGGLFGIMVPVILILHGGLLVCRYLLLPYFGEFPSFITLYGILLLLYITSVLCLDQTALKPLPNGVRRQPRNWMEHRAAAFWTTHFDYFPMTFHVDNHNDDDKNKPVVFHGQQQQQYIFAVHTHGIHCWPLNMLAFASSPFHQTFPLSDQVTGLAATVLFHIPVVRELFLAMGYVDASRRVATNVLQQGRSLFVCTGGSEESLRTLVGRDCVVLRNRKGFVRLTVSHGCALVPVFGIGNSDLYQTYQFLFSSRLWLQKTAGIALPIFHGRLWSPLPFRRPLKVVFGCPILVDPKHVPSVKGDRPDEAVVDQYHAKYIEAVKALHKKHGEGRVLEIR